MLIMIEEKMSKKLFYGDWWASKQCEDYRWSMMKKSCPILNEVPVSEFQENSWLTYLKNRILPTIPSTSVWLSLCCGQGSLERTYATQKVFSTCLAIDFSEKQLRIARRLGSGIANVKYEQEDLNQAVFEENAFDFVILQGGAHHISNLDHLFGQIRRCLRPGGYFALHEYVGPVRFKYDQSQIDLINKASSRIPPKYRPSANPNLYYRFSPYDLSKDNAWRRNAKIFYYWIQKHWSSERTIFYNGQFSMRPLQRILDNDPSEAVSGPNILSSLERYFQIVDYMPIGGTIISNIQDFDWEFDDSLEFRTLVNDLFEYEGELIGKNIISSDYAAITVQNQK